MTNEDFEKLFDSLIRECTEIMSRKGIEYANGDDRLGNFKRAAERKGVTPETIALIYADKHLDSIAYTVRQIEETGEIPQLAESLESRFCDVINYFVLLYGIIEERLRRAQ